MKKKTNSRLSSNSEANASELLENPEDMFSVYYMHSDMFNTFKSSIIPKG